MSFYNIDSKDGVRFFDFVGALSSWVFNNYFWKNKSVGP